MIKELRIIIIEDAPSDVILLNNELRQSGLLFRSTRIENRHDFVREIECHSPDIILSDHGVPGFDGFAALETAQQLCPRVPFIFVTGADGDEMASETLKRGATDYVLKKNLNQLGDAIQRALESREQPSPLGRPVLPAAIPASRQASARPPVRAKATDVDLQELVVFVKTIAAELRPPARHIENFSELVLKSNRARLDSKTVHHLQTISESTQKLGGLLDSLETYVRIGHDRLAQLEFDLAETVNEVISDTRRGKDEREIEWIIGKLPRVTGDPALLSLALAQLIDNALKFSSNQPKSVIEIGGSQNASEIIIFVSDNGTGFDQEKAETVFQLFSRLHPGESFPGLGIGLANVRRIIERHQGRVWAESSKGFGTRISFSLPLAAPGATKNIMQG